MDVRVSPEKREEYRQLSGGSDELLLSLIDKYLEHTPIHLEAAKKAFAEGDIRQLDFAIHTMKGSTLSLGIEPLGDFLTKLNQETKVGKTSSFPQAFEILEQGLQELRRWKNENFG
ncbi:MAG: Hpt domain-containing protein [Leptospiraceae bacterium]|nr:Hpt domain-containing protein [Leptospiraceae bacterium]MDW8306487.1 Hpt domain-containing protein [Leptospiraceae bacterium]